MRSLNFGLVGAGARGLILAAQIKRHGDQLAAVYDPDQTRLKQFSRLSGYNYSEAENSSAVLSDHGLDAVIISSPDVFHAEQLAQALASTQNVYCEKPLATDVRAHHRLLDIPGAATESVFVSGLVLRFHRFHRRLIRLARGLGRLHFVQASDLLPGAFYFRRWHRLRKYSGGLMCHEGVHTFDIVQQIVGAWAAQVTAQGRLTRYMANPAAGDVCSKCAVSGTCPEFFDVRTDPLFDLYCTPTRQMGYPRDLCVYNSEKDVPDTAAATVIFEEGPVFSYSLSLTAPRRTRLFRIIGERGMVEGDEAESTLLVTSQKGETMKHRIEVPGTLFGGSDDACFGYFRKAVAEGHLDPSLYTTALESNALVLAVELSMRKGGRTIPVSGGRVELATAG